MGEYKSASMSEFFSNLIKLSDVVKNDIVTKDVYNAKTKTI